MGNGKYYRYYRYLNPINITGRIKKGIILLQHILLKQGKAALAPYHNIKINKLPNSTDFFNIYRENDIYRMYWPAIDLLNS